MTNEDIGKAIRNIIGKTILKDVGKEYIDRVLITMKVEIFNSEKNNITMKDCQPIMITNLNTDLEKIVKIGAE
jgi:hypothetical protein